MTGDVPGIHVHSIWLSPFIMTRNTNLLMHSRGTGNVPIRSDPIRVPNNSNNGRNGAEEDSGIIIVLFTLIAFARVPGWYRMLSVISQWLLVLHRNIDTCLGHCYSSHGLGHPIMILFRFTRVNKLALNFIDNSLYRLIALNIPLGL